MEEKTSLKKKLFGKIGRKLVFLFIVIVLIISIGGTYIYYVQSSQIIKNNAISHLESVAQLIENYLNEYIEEQGEKLKIAATHSELTIDELKGLVELEEEFYELFIIDPQGKINLSSDESQIGKDKSNDLYFINIVNKTYFKPAYFSETTQRQSIAISTPFHDKILVARIDLEIFDKVISNKTGLGKTGESLLAYRNKNGDAVFFSKRRFSDRKGEIITKEHTKIPITQALLKKEEAFLGLKDYRNVKVIAVTRYIKLLDMGLVVKIDEQEALGIARDQLFNTALGIIAITGILMIILIISITNKISKPIEQLHSAAYELQNKNFKARVNIKTGDELEELGNTFNKTIEALEKMDDEHKQLEKTKTEFLSITSHELRSPMTPMKAQLQMLGEEYFGKLNKKQKESIEIVERNTTRLDRILVDFLDISRIEAARLKFNFIKTSLNPYIERLIKEMDGFMPEKKIKIESKIEKLPIMEVDPDRVMQVLRNLLNNAKKFSPENKKIEVSTKLENNMILFSVKDQGIGIKSKDLQKILDPFFQAEQTMYREHDGTGLGLSICRGIVESQKGKFWLESELGKGTTFNFTVPLKPVKDIQPIKVLFSSQEDIEKKINNLLKEMLGPIGTYEFQNLKNKNKIIKEELIDYTKELIEKKIIDKEKGDLIETNIKEIFGEKGNKEKISKKLKSKKSNRK